MSQPSAFKRIMIVDNAEPGGLKSGSYETGESRGVYFVLRGAQPVTFTVLNIVDDILPAELHVDDVVALSGDYGEVQYKSGSSTSVPDLGILICTVSHVVRTN